MKRGMEWLVSWINLGARVSTLFGFGLADLRS